MALSRQQKATIMMHILKTVMDMDDDSKLHRTLTLNRIKDPFMLCSFLSQELDAFQYTDDVGALQPVLKGNIGLLKAFKAYVAH